MSKFRKVSPKRAFVCLLAIFALLTAWMAFAESTANEEATSPWISEEIAPVEDAGAAATGAESTDPEINFFKGLGNIAKSTGIAQSVVANTDENDDVIYDENGEVAGHHFEWRNYAMLAVACFLLYLAIVKQFEPLLLLPIAFGMLLANLPAAGLMGHASYTYFNTIEEGVAYAKTIGKDAADVIMRAQRVKDPITGIISYTMMPALQTGNAGLLYYLYQGVKLGIYPPLIFMGVGAMTDFGPLIANPQSLLLGAAAQLGIFLTFLGAKAIFGFSAAEAGAIGIIGGADGPTAIFVTTRLAPHLLGPIAVAAYSYMALVPVIQPPIMKALTTKKERQIRMGQLRQVSKTELIIFPIAVTIIVSLLLPDAATLVGMLMLGNLMRVCGVVERLNKTAQNELCNIVTIFLGLTVGATTTGSSFLNVRTLYIVVLGVIAFGFGTAGGVLLAKVMNILSGGQINPLIGSAGVSAVPMAARVSQKVGQEEDPGNFLLMHAMGPNVAGVIGSAVAAGVFIALFG